MAKKTPISKSQTPSSLIVCTPKDLPTHLLQAAAEIAWAINPVNKPPVEQMAAYISTALVGDVASLLQPSALALLSSKWWGSGGVDITVGFMDNPTQAFRRLFLSHANVWGDYANVKFRETTDSRPQVRLARSADGYWSYIGTDILSIPTNQPTMNLAGFTERTPEPEWKRVCRHEVGHTIGCPHEQLRLAIVSRIDPGKAIAYFRQTSGWGEATTRWNVLTPMEEKDLKATTITDETSVMCYQLPASIMRDGKAVPGGYDISEMDKMFISTIYPRATQPPPPPPPPGPVEMIHTLVIDLNKKKVTYDGKEL